MIDAFDNTWKTTAHVIIDTLRYGTPKSRRMAEQQVLRMAELLDAQNEVFDKAQAKLGEAS